MTAKLGVVYWEDATFYQNLQSIENENYLTESISVGYVFFLKGQVGVIQTIQGDTKDVIFIPRKWVQKIIYLKEKNGSR